MDGENADNAGAIICLIKHSLAGTLGTQRVIQGIDIFESQNR
jgi:hypothetical protein